MKASSQVDFLVMGAGVAGLRAAVELARHGEVLVVTKESVAESNTHYAQGGIAVAMEGDRDVALHLDDTVNAGDGLVYRPAAQALVAEGPVRVAELIEWGANFDTEAGVLLRTREGAHSRPASCTPTATPPAPRSAARWPLLPASTSASALQSGPRSPTSSSPMAASSGPTCWAATAARDSSSASAPAPCWWPPAERARSTPTPPTPP